MKLVIRDVTFDSDVVVSVFETNIRVVGWVTVGLHISLKILILYIQIKFYVDKAEYGLLFYNLFILFLSEVITVEESSAKAT